MDKKIVYVDTDVSLGTPGAEIDDGAALIFLLRHPLVEVVGAGSVFGNTSQQDFALNLDRLLVWMGAGHVPVASGASTASIFGYGLVCRLAVELRRDAALGPGLLPSGQPT